MKTESKLWLFVERYVVAFALFDILWITLLCLWIPRMDNIATWLGSNMPWVGDHVAGATVGMVGLALFSLLGLMWLTGSKRRSA